MARMRYIKPEFWTDSKVVKLSPSARLLFQGMWNFALCDQGHVSDDPLQLKLQILPMDDIEIDCLIDELLASGMVRRIENGDGDTFLHVRALSKHQKIDPRWTPRCPVCAQNDSLTLSETLPNSPKLSQTPRVSPKLASGGDRRGDSNTCSSGDERSQSNTRFDEFYAAYPKKVAKKKAQTKFATAVKQGTDPQAIIAGAKRYATEVAHTDPKFIKQPDGWLESGRWDDEPVEEVKPPRSLWDLRNG